MSMQQLTAEEDLARACVRTGRNPIGEARAMHALCSRLGVDPVENQKRIIELWRRSNTAAEILSGLRALATSEAAA